MVVDRSSRQSGRQGKPGWGEECPALRSRKASSATRVRRDGGRPIFPPTRSAGQARLGRRMPCPSFPESFLANKGQARWRSTDLPANQVDRASQAGAKNALPFSVDAHSRVLGVTRSLPLKCEWGSRAAPFAFQVFPGSSGNLVQPPRIRRWCPERVRCSSRRWFHARVRRMSPVPPSRPRSGRILRPSRALFCPIAQARRRRSLSDHTHH
jgi:hypothetical protein